MFSNRNSVYFVLFSVSESTAFDICKAWIEVDAECLR